MSIDADANGRGVTRSSRRRDRLGRRGPAAARLAVAELQWLADLARERTCDQQLLRLVGEAARPCGWLRLDADQHAAAAGVALRRPRVDGDDIDPACREFAAVIALAARTGSVRAMSTVREARRAWDVRAGEAAVRAFDGSLTALG